MKTSEHSVTEGGTVVGVGLEQLRRSRDRTIRQVAEGMGVDPGWVIYLEQAPLEQHSVTLIVNYVHALGGDVELAAGVFWAHFGDHYVALYATD